MATDASDLANFERRLAAISATSSDAEIQGVLGGAEVALQRDPERFAEPMLRAASRTHNDAFAHRVIRLYTDARSVKKVAHILELDLAPKTVRYCLWWLSITNQKVDPKRVKRLLPALRVVADRLRNDPAARPRLEAAEEALEQPGCLLSPAPQELPKPPPAVALKQETGTDGGPVLALPKEVVGLWGGTMLPDGRPCKDEKTFAGTDYGRACAIAWGPQKSPWGGYGFIQVGELRGLVLGDHCSVAKRKDGTCLLVMEGDGEDLAALLEDGKPWKELEGELKLPSGQLVLCDSAYVKAKTNNRSIVKLNPGRYSVEEYDCDDRPGSAGVWCLRLTPRGR
jgi:hypothetical protein